MSEVTTDGRPVVNVGAVLNVRHSNIEATGTAFTGLKPKPGGNDFHMVYDYRHRERYRVTTVGGKGTKSEDLSASTDASELPYRAILHAEAAHMHSRPDYAAALASDGAFRRSDDPEARDGTAHLEHQEIDPVSPPVGYARLEEGERRGGVLLDQHMGGCSVRLHPSGIEIGLPVTKSRSRATFAVERSLFRNSGEGLAVTVDGRAVARPVVRPTPSMIVVDLTLDAARHTVQVLEGKAPLR